MTDYKKIIMGVASFFTGYIAIYVMNTILPTLISVGQNLFNSNTDIEGIIWLGAILAWTLIGVITPSFLIISGLKEGNPQSKTGEIVMAILIFLFSILFTRFAWYMIATFTALNTEPIITIIFWIGLILVWTEVTIGVPAYLIIKNVKD